MSQESSGPDSSNISTTTSGQNRLKTPFVGENTAELRIGIFPKYCRIMNRHTSKPAISVQYVLTILNSAYLSATLSSMPILNSADFFVIMPLFTLKCTLPLPSPLTSTISSLLFIPPPPYSITSTISCLPFTPLPPYPSTSTISSLPFTLPPPYPFTSTISSLLFIPPPPYPFTSTMSSLPFTPPQPSPSLNVLTYYNLFLSFYSAMDHPPKQRIQCTVPIPTRNQRHLHNAPNLIRLWM